MSMAFDSVNRPISLNGNQGTATASDDPEITQFAGDMLKRISLAGGS
jgi:hypothetical protein